MLPAARADSAGSSGGYVSVADVRFDVVRVSEGVLQLALPDWNCFGVFMASGEEAVWAEFEPAALAGFAAAGIEVFVAGIFCLGDFNDVRGGHTGFHDQPVRIDRGCEDAELFPAYWGNGAGGFGSDRGGVGVRAEFLVQIFVPVRG